jgi:hypothetical protein
VADRRRTVGVITACDGVEPLAAELMLAVSLVVESAFLFFFFPKAAKKVSSMLAVEWIGRITLGVAVKKKKKIFISTCSRTFISKILEHAELESDIYRSFSPG